MTSQLLILVSLIAVTIQQRSDNDCLMRMAEDNNCVPAILSAGFVPKKYEDDGCTACDNSKNEYCAQKVQNNEIVSDAPPTCQQIPQPCMAACRSGSGGGGNGGGGSGTTPGQNNGGATPTKNPPSGSSSSTGFSGSSSTPSSFSSSSSTSGRFTSSSTRSNQGFSTNAPQQTSRTSSSFSSSTLSTSRSSGGVITPSTTRPNGVTPPSVRPPSSGTQDKHIFCCFWAQANECSSNSGWMNRNCADSCGGNGQDLASRAKQNCAYKFTGMQDTRPFSYAEYLQTQGQNPAKVIRDTSAVEATILGTPNSAPIEKLF